MKRRLAMAASFFRPARRRDGADDRELAATHEPDIRLRWASEDDESVLRTLAALDGAAVPARPVLIGEVEGHPWAAISACTGELVADPFRPTASVRELLRVRAEQITAAAPTPTAARLQ
jgi:hypothetical protein